MPGPGVQIKTATRGGTSSPLLAVSGQYFTAGLAERGPTGEPATLRSMADYSRFFGNRVAYGTLFDDLTVFFAEGGSQAHVVRVVGPAATEGTLVLVDGSAGAGLQTLRIDAENEGAWSSRLTVEVVAGTNPDTFRLRLRLDGAIVEDYNNLANPTAAVNALKKSALVRATDLGSGSVAPDNNPRVMAETALSAGADDRAAVTAAMVGAAFDLFPKALGDGAVGAAGFGESIHADLIAHGVAHNRVALLSADRGTTVEDLTALASGYDAENAELHAPWITVSDGAGGQRVIDPVGYVAACRNRAHEQVGPWRAPAGRIAQATTVLGVDQDFTDDDSALLNDGRVNAIRVIANSVRLYGWRSLSQDEDNFALLTVQDLINRVVTEIAEVLEDVVFSPVDPKGAVLATAHADCVNVLAPIASAGGLFEKIGDDGNQIDPGYSVDTSNAINTTDTLSQRKLIANVALRPSPTAEFIEVTVTNVGLAAAV